MTPTRFHLEYALAAWRRSLEHSRAFTADDLDELEQHVRDQMASLTKEGLGEEAAFRRALREMGDYTMAETEYRKVYWGKRRRRGEVLHEINWWCSMLKNYFTVAWRNVLRQKGYAFINLVGLAVGLACFILILLFTRHERSYDRFHEKAERIYRVIQRQPGNIYLGTDYFAVTPARLAHDLVEEFSQISDATTIGIGDPSGGQGALLSLDEQRYWERGLWADARFFHVFTFPVLRGDPATALADPNSIVLSQTLAHKMFGAEDPMGQMLLYENKHPFTVTGIMADVPNASHFTFDFVISIQSNPDYARQISEPGWSQNAWYTYFVLAAGAEAEKLEGNMLPFVAKHRYAGRDVPEEKRVRFLFQPLTDIHLHSQINFELAANGDSRNVYLFSIIGFVILLLACVNYTNLAVARSIKRMREVGMRKVVGAGRRQLIVQFLCESVLTAFLALVLALGLVHLALPVFGHLVERAIRIEYIGNAPLYLGLLALTILVGLVAGGYPAIFMASQRPIQVLKGLIEGGAGRLKIQRLLIVGQYAVSIAFVVGSLVVYEQLQFVRQKELGYDREQVISVRVRDDALRQNYELVRQEWLRDPRVVAVAASRSLPTDIEGNTGIHGWEGSSPDDNLRIYQTEVDYDFLDVFGIELASGRTFSREFAEDESACLINETAVRALGWTPEEALGMRVMREGEQLENTVIGVMKDFHMHSMHRPIEPLLIYLDPGRMWYISAKVRADNLPETIAFLEKTLRRITPYPFEYQFLDQIFDRLYTSEQRLGQMFAFFTVLAVLIASLGLFGLAAYAAEQRTLEIGIRKVLGADVSGLVALLSKDFLKLVGFAFLAGAPSSYFAMHRWLESFAYRIEIGPGIFMLTGVLTLLIVLTAVSYQSIKAALADPVKSLHYE